MSWNYLYDATTGALISETTADINPVPAGRAVATFADRQTGKAWDPVAHTFSEPPVVKPKVVSNSVFLQRMTPEERIGVRTLAKTDAIAEDFMQLLNASAEVHLDNPNVSMGLGYLVSKGCLTAERAAAIGDH